MNARTIVVTGLLLLALPAGAWAQTPATAATAATTAASSASGSASQASGLLGLIQAACGALKACKAKLCACPIGQMISNMTKPFNLATGNLLCGTCCPEINPNDLKKGGPQGACAKIRQEMAEVPERRAAVRCLAYIDCHWYPEAEKALTDALRTDRSECVRLEAAVALGSGCCCTRKTIEALTLAVNGSDKDGNPGENSPRVKQAAYISLQKCVGIFHDDSEPQRPEQPVAVTTPDGTPIRPVARTHSQEEARLYAEAVAEARRALEEHRVIVVTPPGRPRTGQRSLTQMWQIAATEPPPAVASTPATLEPPTADSEPVMMQTGRRSLYQMWVDSFRKPKPTVAMPMGAQTQY